MFDLLNDTCPVPLDLLGSLYRADRERFDAIMNDLPESTRAQLAIYLYGRSHTHALGIRVAAGCDGASLRRAGGLVGNALYDQSRQPAARHARHEGTASKRTTISLGGVRAASLHHAL